jgi:hypothetical protein
MSWPSWAIFLLPPDTLSGNWEIREYDANGDYKLKGISHAIVYGLPCAQLPCDDEVNVDVDPPPVPEPGTLMLLAVGAAAAAFARRRASRK